MPLVRAFGLYVGALAVTLALSTYRLRDLALGGAPLALWFPFFRPLLATAFEASLLVGVPMAWLSAWKQAGAARSLGAHARRLMPFALVLTSVSAGGAVWMDVGSRAPGVLAQELVDAARATCETSSERSVQVPLVPVAWACPQGAKAVVSGATPGFGVKFAATSLKVSPDLRQVELTGAALELPKRTALRVRIATESARIRGLRPWGRPRHVSLGVRLFFAALGALAAVLAAVRILGGTREAALAPAVGALCGIVLVGMQALLDRWGAAGVVYWGLGPVAALTVALVALLLRITRARLERAA